MKKFILGLVTLFIASSSYAALPVVSESLNSEAVYEINNATPGTSKTFLGTRLQGPLTIGSTTFASGDNGNPTSVTFTTPTTTVFLKTTGASVGESYRLGNGYSKQRLTAVLVTDGGQNFVITPQTKTGFTSATLNDANDTVTLEYVDSTVGWVLVGNNGATIN